MAPAPVGSTSARTGADPGAEEQLPRDFHNLFVIIIVGLVLAWMAKVLYQLFRAADLNARLAYSQSLQLEGMSVYAADFQTLIRQHFNQILRIRRTVPPKPVTRQALSAHLHPDSIAVWSGDGTATAGGRAGALFGVQFTVDALVPCCVKLFWGVSVVACNEFVQRRQHGSQASPDAGRWGGARGGKGSSGRGGGGADAGVGRGRRWPRPASSVQESTRSLLEMEELSGGPAPGASASEDNQSIFAPGQYVAQSRDFFLPAGLAQRYTTPAGDLIDPSQLPFDVSAAWLRDGQAADDAAVVPLAVLVIAQRRPGHELGGVQGRPTTEAHGQLSLVKFRLGEAGGLRAPEIIRQLSFGERCAAYEVQGVYGFEDEGEGDCMICYARPKNVLLLPCRHCSVCHPCLRSLRDEKCPLCRSVFSSYVTFPISRAAPAAEERAPASPADRGSAPPPACTPPPAPAGASSALGGTPGDAVGPASGAGGEEGTQGKERAARQEPPARPGPQPPSSVELAVTGGGQERSPAGRPPWVAAAASGAGQAGAQPGAGGQESPRAHVEPARQARELQLGRPRGVAPASRTTAQGLRLSGRARFNDRTDNAEAPLLQEGAAPPPRAAEGEAEAEDCRSRREQATGAAVQEGPGEETQILIRDGAAEAV